MFHTGRRGRHPGFQRGEITKLAYIADAYHFSKQRVGGNSRRLAKGILPPGLLLPANLVAYLCVFHQSSDRVPLQPQFLGRLRQLMVRLQRSLRNMKGVLSKINRLQNPWCQASSLLVGSTVPTPSVRRGRNKRNLIDPGPPPIRWFPRAADPKWAVANEVCISVSCPLWIELEANYKE